MNTTRILLLAALFATLAGAKATAAPSQQPLFLGTSAPPLMMLVMQRDHKLYYEAYNDASDINGDGVPDVGFKPATDYLGYFGTQLCYTYSNGSARFEPTRISTTKECPGEWSGNFLNYVTTSRMDALRRVLYGGYRSTDTATETVLERAYIPQDAHSWGKEYTGIAENGYDITKYTPLALPDKNTRHILANLTILKTSPANPLLRIRTNTTFRVWEWMSKERPVGDTTCVNAAGSNVTCDGTLQDLVVRVKTCVAGLIDGEVVDANTKMCRPYGSNYKPTGLLQKYGETEAMHFGLLTGSYQNNKSGGVLRKNVGLFTDEINALTGQFKLQGDNDSAIINTINRLKATGFAGDWLYDCKWTYASVPLPNGQCQMWGNPVGEMMYETVRYFAGATATSTFLVAQNAGEESSLKLPVASWKDPYKPAPGGGGAQYCAKPFMLTISDVYPSYDSDELPGAYSAYKAAGFSGSLSTLNVSTEADRIWANEKLASGDYFIGQSSSTNYDSAPSGKPVSGFGSLRGLAPEEPTKEGSYYSAAVARWGNLNDVNGVTGAQKVQTFVVAMASPLPRVTIAVPSDPSKKMTIIPFAKSVRGQSISSAKGAFQPTNQLVDFYISEIWNTGPTNQNAAKNGGRPYYKFQINFEDVEWGADHDMDAIAEYEVLLDTDGKVTVQVTSKYASGGIRQHMGYIVSGSTNDGTHLVVKDLDYNDTADDPDYFLDDPATAGALPLTSSIKYTFGSSSAKFLDHDPLWYAAKYGGFQDLNKSGEPDANDEWSNDGGITPSTYYLVSNPAMLYKQLDKAFADISDRAGQSATMLSLNTSRLSSETRVYQASFDPKTWSGELKALTIDDKGVVGPAVWSASSLIPSASSRHIFTWQMEEIAPATGYTATGVDFAYSSLTTKQKTLLGQAPAFPATVTAANQQDLVAYIRGDQSKEGANYRTRDVVLGDIVNSDPAFGGGVDFGYDRLPASEGGENTYLAYRNTKRAGDQTVYVGANDGMLHAFDAKTGVERFAFIPNGVIENLKNLASVSYKSAHKFFVDGPIHYGDAYIGGAWKSYIVGSTGAGGRSLFALDVTKAAAFKSSDVKWEFTHDDLGYTLSRPVIAKMANGRWAAVTGNGPDSSSGTAKIFIVYLDASLNDTNGWNSGSDYCMLSTDTATSNGMGSPTVVLSDTGTAQYIYAGDLQGRMWRFDVATSAGNCPTGWKSNEVFKAFISSTKPQPITAAPQVDIGPNGGLMVVFGTGKFYAVADTTDLTTQSLYGVWDELTTSPKLTRSNLVQQSITLQASEEFKNKTAKYTQEIRETSAKTVDFTKTKGWYLDLLNMTNNAAAQEGERVLSTPLMLRSNAVFTTFVPSADPCTAGGSSWIFSLNYLTGTRDDTYFDLNRDSSFNEADNYHAGSKAVSGIRYGFGGPVTPVTDKEGRTHLLKPVDDGSNTGPKVEETQVRSARLMSSWRQVK